MIIINKMPRRCLILNLVQGEAGQECDTYPHIELEIVITIVCRAIVEIAEIFLSLYSIFKRR